jgi:hypothetical protein
MPGGNLSDVIETSGFAPRGVGSKNTSGAADKRANLGALPMVIGITGHRDIRPEDVPMLENAVRQFFEKLTTDYPNTPLMLLSPLAEGADRLTARIALACGARLIVPLPMPREVYSEDFKTDESKQEFHNLIEQSELHFELHLVHGTTDASIRAEGGVARTHQYAHVGAYIVRHCQILLGLWDGVVSDQEGGTAQIVQFMHRGVPAQYDSTESPLDPKKTGPVYHIRTPRKSRPDIEGTPGSGEILYPAGFSSTAAAEAAFDRSRRRIDDYNRDSMTLAASMKEAVERNKGYVLSADKAAALPVSQRGMLDNYAVADTLAQYFQADTLRTLRGLFGFALLSLVFFVLFGEYRSYLPLLALAMISPLPMYGIHSRAKKGDFHAKHLDYRALAEGLRIQIFWHIAGLREPVAKHYLRKQRSELDWIRDAINTWNIPMESTHGKADFPVVMEHWVDDQRRYFRKNAERNQEKVDVYDRWVRSLFTWTGALTALLVVLRGVHAAGLFSEDAVNVIQSILMVLVVILPGTAATLDGYAEKLAFAEQAKQYQRMRDLFEVAALRFAESLQEGSEDKARLVIQDLGEEALAENGDWVMIHREKEVEVPHPG